MGHEHWDDEDSVDYQDDNDECAIDQDEVDDE
jgi:hypothetical protein